MALRSLRTRWSLFCPRGERAAALRPADTTAVTIRPQFPEHAIRVGGECHLGGQAAKSGWVFLRTNIGNSHTGPIARKRDKQKRIASDLGGVSPPSLAVAFLRNTTSRRAVGTQLVGTSKVSRFNDTHFHESANLAMSSGFANLGTISKLDEQKLKYP